MVAFVPRSSGFGKDGESITVGKACELVLNEEFEAVFGLGKDGELTTTGRISELVLGVAFRADIEL